MLWIMFKFFLIYLVVVFFIGIFRTWKSVSHVRKAFRRAQQGPEQRQQHSQAGVVEAEYKVLDDNK